MFDPLRQMKAMSPIRMYLDGELVGTLKPTRMTITDGYGKRTTLNITWPEEKQEDNNGKDQHHPEA